MFTGIVRGVGRIAERRDSGGDVRLMVDFAGVALGSPALGDSIAVDGVCLTVTAIEGQCFGTDVSRETLTVTTLGKRAAAAGVNLEPALRAGDALGGHLVSGHVDGLGRLLECSADARSRRLRFAAPAALHRYLARKGSVTVDGISLTINAVDAEGFAVNIVPHTMHHTNLGERVEGDAVNLEIDQVARYLERLVQERE